MTVEGPQDKEAYETEAPYRIAEGEPLSVAYLELWAMAANLERTQQLDPGQIRAGWQALDLVTRIDFETLDPQDLKDFGQVLAKLRIQLARLLEEKRQDPKHFNRQETGNRADTLRLIEWAVPALETQIHAQYIPTAQPPTTQPPSTEPPTPTDNEPSLPSTFLSSLPDQNEIIIVEATLARDLKNMILLAGSGQLANPENKAFFEAIVTCLEKDITYPEFPIELIRELSRSLPMARAALAILRRQGEEVTSITKRDEIKLFERLITRLNELREIWREQKSAQASQQKGADLAGDSSGLRIHPANRPSWAKTIGGSAPNAMPTSRENRITAAIHPLNRPPRPDAPSYVSQ